MACSSSTILLQICQRHTIVSIPLHMHVHISNTRPTHISRSSGPWALRGLGIPRKNMPYFLLLKAASDLQKHFILYCTEWKDCGFCSFFFFLQNKNFTCIIVGVCQSEIIIIWLNNRIVHYSTESLHNNGT